MSGLRYLHAKMKIALSEIWTFSELIDSREEGWAYRLVAGQCTVDGITHDELLVLKKDEQYNTELLPSIFTFREILWQPDVYTDASISLPGLRILQAFCQEMIDELSQNANSSKEVYTKLLQSLSESCNRAEKEIDKNGGVREVLGRLRMETFPIIKFFIFHPRNRDDYHRDAINRLNYAVKVMLTEFQSQYSELQDPYWEVNYSPKHNNLVDLEKKGL